MISRTAIHGLRALMILAEMPPDQYAGTAELAKRIKAPRNYLGKLLQRLADEGLLESQRGKGGGFRLARPPERITIYDVVEPLDRVSRWEGCLLGRSRCSDEAPCPVHVRWAKVRAVYLEFLRTTTLDELVAQRRESPSCRS